jgi:8-oxo-dGTP pyrophosphatase MutT (NUDIX family)
MLHLDARALADALRERLSHPLPGRDAQLRMSPQPRTWPEDDAALRPAAALALLYPRDGEWHIPLTVRSAGLRHHTSQVSFPGGRLDHPGETVEDAALREAYEEVGINRSDVEIIGRLSPMPIAVSRHLLHPVLGIMPVRPVFTIAIDEVDRVIEVPIARLLQPDAIAWEERMRTLPPLVVMNVPYFAIDGARVWGATAMVLAEIIAVLESLNAG